MRCSVQCSVRNAACPFKLHANATTHTLNSLHFTLNFQSINFIQQHFIFCVRYSVVPYIRNRFVLLSLCGTQFTHCLCVIFIYVFNYVITVSVFVCTSPILNVARDVNYHHFASNFCFSCCCLLLLISFFLSNSIRARSFTRKKISEQNETVECFELLFFLFNCNIEFDHHYRRLKPHWNERIKKNLDFLSANQLCGMWTLACACAWYIKSCNNIGRRVNWVWNLWWKIWPCLLVCTMMLYI